MAIEVKNETIYLFGGVMTRVHVNQRNLRAKVKGEPIGPCYTVKHRGETYWANEVEILGPSRLVERIDNPLSCGARLWIETSENVRLH